MSYKHLIAVRSSRSCPSWRRRSRAEHMTVTSPTSTEQSGLFGHIPPIFENKTEIEARVVAQNTCQAL